MPRLTNKAKLMQQVALRLLIDENALATAYETPWSDIDGALRITSTKSDKNIENAKCAYPLLSDKHTKVFAKKKSLTLFKSPFGSWLKSHFKLDDIAYQIVFICQLITSDKQLREIANSLGDINDNKCFELLATLISCSPREVAKRFNLNCPLIKYKLVSLSKGTNEFTRKIYPSDLIEMQLFNPYFDATTMLASYLTEVEEPVLDTAMFRRLNRDVKWIISLLSKYKESPFRGCNILLYGEPGTGKTQLSRVVAQEANLNCYEVNFASQSGEQLTGEERLNKLATSRHFIEKQQNVIVFDELEDAIPLNNPFGHSDMPKKRWFNEMLETNPVPVIWISNTVEHLDPAFLRRFDYCLKVTHPSTHFKKRLMKGLLEIEGEPKWVDQVSKHKHISAADIERAAFVILAAETASEKQKEHYFKNMLAARGESISRSNRKRTSADYVSETKFSPEFSNTSIPLTEVDSIVERSQEGRFLLHGIPGTGKTGYVHYIAEKLNKTLVSKSASDLLGMFVGENEKAIRNMFAEAKHKDAILLLDEADSFFSDRTGHNSEWRTSMVNEMLVQLERFQGVFFASTNLPDHLDKAIKRRFDFHISFNYLKVEQVMAMANSLLNNEDELSHDQINHLTTITPADFSVAARQARLRGASISADSLLELLEEQANSRIPQTNRVGFL
jgi:SpoVK/Ycf46/Vps4 family AAA+-type ATPase